MADDESPDGASRSLSDSAGSARLFAALGAQVAAGAPGAVARIESPRVGLVWAGSAGRLAREEGRALRADDAFRVASVTKSATAAVSVRLAGEGRLALDEPLSAQLAPELLDRWRGLEHLPRTTPRQLLTHTSGVPNYFRDESFAAACARIQAGRGGRSSSSTTRPSTEPGGLLQAGGSTIRTPDT